MEYPQVLSRITTFIFDVDGVLTNGQVIIQESGEQTRIMNIKDGFALQLAVKLGYKVVIISGGKSEAVKTRLQGLGIHDVYLGAADKADVFDEVKITYDLKNEEIAYMGDDIPDYPVMKDVALPCCPADAATEILEISKYISNKKGGEGCGRDLIEKVLRAQKKWFNPENSNNNNKSVVW
ncbi:MAG: 3-deoxy-D-manno-octulosonate 8-phosphate phosphatase (KDO 8-P phosphatase) [Saprospiraceae bacterium]|jgi:3-deoxy-D-manno-octulosonate 8-phosphate phosphatase (KDO 8-P phosphatase)